MNNTLKMGFVAAITVFTLAIMSAQAGGEAPPIKGGIADLRYIKTKMTVNVSASNNTTARNADEGSATTGDTTTGTTSGEVSTAGTATCDFSGFAQNDLINNAYAGGASLTGVVKPNIHIGYFDARVLNAYFGANEPNPGIVYSNTGSILVSLQNIAGTNFAFSYTCAVKLTVRTFSSVDGSGTALNTYTLAKNLPGTMGPYNVWTNFSQPIDPTVHSISISGDAARWGMDQVVVTNSCATSSPARKVAVFMNSAFVQTCTSYDCEGTNTVNMLTSLGYNVTTFSGITAADWTQQFNDKRIIVIPEQELSAIASSLDGASRLALANGVASGGSVLVFGVLNSNAESFLNIAGSLSLSHSTNSPSSTVALNSANVAGTPFMSGPSILSRLSATCTNTGWPSSSVIAYGSTSAVWVASATTGLGQVGFVAYDYFNPSGQSASGNWTLVVDKMIQQLSVKDCNSNGLDDICEIDSGQVADIDGNHVPDTCQTDCNGNGQPDQWEISTGLVRDCNGNGIPDSCDITFGPVAQSRNGTLVTNGGTVNTAFTGLPNARGDVSMTFSVNADIDNGGSSEFVMFTATGSPISVTITGTACSTEVRTISVPAATYNAALVSGTLGFAIKTGPQTDSCVANTWKIDLTYSDELDCDGNGVIDRCEIADGSAVDQNGNGVPDSCDPFPVLRLTTNAAACNTVGSTVTVDATLSGVLNNVVAGQLLLTWDVSKLSFAAVLPGDAPYTTAYALNEQSGTIMILASTTAGGTGTTAASAVVSRIQFTVIGGSCSGTGNEVDFFTFGPMETEFTDGYGGATVPTLLASAGFVVDDGAPVLSNVPADGTVQAEAGMGSFANYFYLPPPMATDACAPGLTTSSSRSDGASLSAAFPVGTTTVTWSATDPCANTTTATTRVTVNNSNTATFAVSYTNSASYAASSARTLTLNIHGANGYTLKASQPVTLVNGAGTISLTDLAVDNYDCVAIEEQGRSLRRVATMSDAGLIWSSTATLVAGDLIDDEVIDVLDWGAYIVGNPNADLDGNGVINAVDGNIIITNFGLRGETGCGTSFMGPPDPISAISVAELVERGLTDLIGADLNNDGWLDMEDVRMASN